MRRLQFQHDRTQLILLTLALATASTGCNILSFLDQPGSSEQFLSRARACMDKGDYACARENYANYAKSPGDELDHAKSEHAFAILAAEGVEIGDFYNALTATSNSTGSGASVNTLANQLATLTPGEAKRQALFEAFQLAADISDASRELRGLTRLVTSMSLLSEMMAETAGTDGLDASDYISDPTACSLADCANLTPATECNPAVFTQSSAITLTDWTAETAISEIEGSVPTMDMIRLSINQINLASEELGRGGSTQDAANFADAFEGLPISGEPIYDRCFMQTLLQQGVGQ